MVKRLLESSFCTTSTRCMWTPLHVSQRPVHTQTRIWFHSHLESETHVSCYFLCVSFRSWRRGVGRVSGGVFALVIVSGRRSRVSLGVQHLGSRRHSLQELEASHGLPGCVTSLTSFIFLTGDTREELLACDGVIHVCWMKSCFLTHFELLIPKILQKC